MSAPAVSAPLAQLPNALTILRLALIPVFVLLLVPADGGYSWAAAIVFAVAGSPTRSTAGLPDAGMSSRSSERSQTRSQTA